MNETVAREAGRAGQRESGREREEERAGERESGRESEGAQASACACACIGCVGMYSLRERGVQHL